LRGYISDLNSLKKNKKRKRIWMKKRPFYSFLRAQRDCYFSLSLAMNNNLLSIDRLLQGKKKNLLEIHAKRAVLTFFDLSKLDADFSAR
jgi:hypothetical protein